MYSRARCLNWSRLWFHIWAAWKKDTFSEFSPWSALAYLNIESIIEIDEIVEEGDESVDDFQKVTSWPPAVSVQRVLSEQRQTNRAVLVDVRVPHTCQALHHWRLQDGSFSSKNNEKLWFFSGKLLIFLFFPYFLTELLYSGGTVILNLKTPPL